METASLVHPSDIAERNVVILGKEGTGKRTLENHVVGRDVFQPKTKRHSDTTTNITTNEQQVQNMFCRILIVQQTDNLTHLRQRFERIHLVIFVIPKGRYTAELN